MLLALLDIAGLNCICALNPFLHYLNLRECESTIGWLASRPVYKKIALSNFIKLI
jgi:hypothetical protein